MNITKTYAEVCRPKVVCVEGNIGSGKTEILRHMEQSYPDTIQVLLLPFLSAHFNIQRIENVDESNLLKVKKSSNSMLIHIL